MAVYREDLSTAQGQRAAIMRKPEPLRSHLSDCSNYFIRYVGARWIPDMGERIPESYDLMVTLPGGSRTSVAYLPTRAEAERWLDIRCGRHQAPAKKKPAARSAGSRPASVAATKLRMAKALAARAEATDDYVYVVVGRERWVVGHDPSQPDRPWVSMTASGSRMQNHPTALAAASAVYQVKKPTRKASKKAPEGSVLKDALRRDR